MRALVVDDEPAILAVLSRLLYLNDFDVETAKNGADALAKIRQTPPDVVISDVMMPLCDGLEMCRRLKSDAASSSIPVILISGKPDPSLDELALASGAVAFFSKPVPAQQLIDVILAAVHDAKR